MADAVTTKVIESNVKYHIVEITNVSDGTGESNVVKVDKSTLVAANGLEPRSVSLEEIDYDIAGFTSITLSWDRATDEVITKLSGNNSGSVDYGRAARKESKAQSFESTTGDVLLTTVGHTAGDTYRIKCKFRLEPRD